MKKLVTTLTMLLFVFVMISCDETNNKKDDENIVDEGNTGDDGETDDTGNTGNTGDTGDDTAEPEKCKVDPAILDVVEGYESYYALNIIAPINDSTSTERPAGPVYSKFKINIDGHPEIKLDPNFIFVRDNIQDSTLDIYTLGDLGNNQQYYYTFMVTALPLEWVDLLRENEETKLDTVPFTQVLTLEEFTGYLKQCVIGIGSLVTTEEGQFAEGNMELCYDQNKNFEIGENLRLGFNAKINTNKQDIVDLFSNVNSVEELCTCFDSTTDEQIPCPGEETDDDPETDDDAEENDDDTYVDPCTPNPCTEANKTVCTDTDLNGVAECACDATYHLEEAVCVSDTKNIPCDQTDVTVPANAAIVVADVEVTWNGTAWTAPAKCAWACNTDYDKEGETCINTKNVPCDQTGVTVPANAAIVVADVEVTYTTADDWADPAKCGWACNANYVINEDEDGCDAVVPE